MIMSLLMNCQTCGNHQKVDGSHKCLRSGYSVTTTRIVHQDVCNTLFSGWVPREAKKELVSRVSFLLITLALVLHGIALYRCK